MMIKNRLDRSFGPAGTSAGIILFVAGLILSAFYFSGIILILVGAFVGFSCTGTTIDPDKKRIRFSNYIFGIIPVGKWVEVEPSMKIGIKELNQIYTSYSRGNRALDIPMKDFRLILFDSGNREIMQVKKYSSIDLAKSGLEALMDQLGLREEENHSAPPKT